MTPEGFATVNMHNLVPMGRDCNTIFKKRKDILFKDGVRRRAFRPFTSSGVRIQVELSGSQLPTVANRKGRWNIQMSPSRQEVATWIDVFETSSRYKKYVFEAKATG